MGAPGWSISIIAYLRDTLQARDFLWGGVAFYLPARPCCLLLRRRLLACHPASRAGAAVKGINS